MSLVNPSREESLDSAPLPLQAREKRATDADLLQVLLPPVRTIKVVPPPSSPFIYREIKQGYHPGRGLGLSFFFHLFLLAIIIASRSSFLYSNRVVVEPPPQPATSATVLYLPVLGGGSEGSGPTGGGSGHTAEVSQGVRSRSRRGFAYRGPRPMVSSPPRARLGIQTILQPALKDPPLLKQYMPLPDIVKPAAPSVEAERKALVVNQETIALRSTPEQPIAPPKLTLPAAAVSAIPALPAYKATLPEEPVVKPVVPNAPEISDVPFGRQEKEGLLVMNAIAPPPDLTAKIPRAEERSLFAVAPAEVTVIADPAAGAKGGEASAASAGSGTRTDIAKGDALAAIAAGGNAASPASSGSGTGSGSRYGSGRGSGLNPSGNSGGASRGTGTDAGVGTGSGTSIASGTGAGSAPGKGGFPGIAIQGGRYGNAGDLHASSAPRRQTSYNMNIVSTASSGGGLPDFGVFNNEKVYTVYLDMKASDEDPAPNWILQYALLQPAPDPSGTDGTSSKIRGTPTPPYALLKETPEFAPDLLRKYAHNLIVAFAIMNSDGKLEQITLRQNSDLQLASRLIEALSHWTFQPAQIDGKPVSLKIVLGVRLAPGR
jgi:hypothetical protein